MRQISESSPGSSLATALAGVSMSTWKRLPFSQQLRGHRLPTSPLILGLLALSFSYLLFYLTKTYPWLVFISATILILSVVLRTRNAVQQDAEKLRGTVKELEAKTKTLERARLANVMSVKERGRRIKEVEALKRKVQESEEMCEGLKAERDNLEEKVEVLSKENVEFKEKAEKLEKRCEILEKELENAVFVRWKLISRIHGDEKARIAAVNKLRRPQAHYHIDRLDNLSNRSHSPPKRLRSPMGISPSGTPSRFVPKSPSESYLLDLHPDLGVSESENDEDLVDMMPTLSLNSRGSKKGEPIDSPFSKKSSPTSPVSLSRSPWTERKEASGLGDVASLLEPESKMRRSMSSSGI
eukprot:Plantae.Rhodophyta-Hildenbrandia_rubra.ctg15664.p1 GENE.Plantae.Rhodophyta-Hildenbrandia_rubra.ctg15664~~Plantae.Rhodophyta-Hildenbrandia_rubra.ctg15664.p1  ORF type:complete len:355 (-),score=62.84 Plantae.Rhodophyta-Hildenbrandia_rubra.ctg15664:142-1206(-)